MGFSSSSSTILGMNLRKNNGTDQIDKNLEFPEFLIGIFMKTKAQLVLPLKLTLRFDGRGGSSEVKNQPLCPVFVIFALLLFFQDAEGFAGEIRIL